MVACVKRVNAAVVAPCGSLLAGMTAKEYKTILNTEAQGARAQEKLQGTAPNRATPLPSFLSCLPITTTRRCMPSSTLRTPRPPPTREASISSHQSAVATAPGARHEAATYGRSTRPRRRRRLASVDRGGF